MKTPSKTTAVKISLLFLCGLCVLLVSGCRTDARMPASAQNPAQPVAVADSSVTLADAATILCKTEVPILCYHQLRDFRPSDSRTARDYIVPVAAFQEQMKLLADSGYQTILPNQLYDYLVSGKPLPPRPVMITFDDTRLDQYTVALPELNKLGFKGVFFIMTVSLGRPGYMNTEQLIQLADEGHTVGSHTWNHENVKNYTDKDWRIQIEKPARLLEMITGKPTHYFAYPFGLWSKEAITNLKQRGFKAVFQLSGPPDETDPLFTIRRIIVPGHWDAATMLKRIKSSFKGNCKQSNKTAENKEH
jgi:peptidoglycan/xylan/chitin deacetylase (PgdA/CDA1 family)